MKLYVGNLAYSVNDSTLRALFEPHPGMDMHCPADCFLYCLAKILQQTFRRTYPVREIGRDRELPGLKKIHRNGRMVTYPAPVRLVRNDNAGVLCKGIGHIDQREVLLH